MSKRYWLPIFAIAGLAIVAVLFWQTDVCQDAGAHSSPAETAAAVKDKGDPCADPELSSIQRIACALEAIKARQDSDDESKRAQSDLDAQWKMAYWARCMFWATVLQGLIGLCSLVLIAVTVKYTGDTARAGIEAAKAAEKAADAAKDQSESLKREFIVAHRPRIIMMVAQVNSHIANVPMTVRFRIANVGETPANIVAVRHALLAVNYVPAAVDLTPEPIQDTLISGESISWNFTSKEVSVNEAGAPNSPGIWDVFCVAEVVYKDDLGVIRRTGICRRYDRNTKRFVATKDPDHEYAY